jgi:hypothetical protein
LTKRGSGLLLTLTVIVALGTIVQDYRFNTSIAREHATTLAIDRELNKLEVALANFRAAQAAYVAAGQGPDFWVARTGELAATLRSSIQQFADATVSPDARARYDAATGALTELLAIDGRARDNVERDQRLFASDLVFMDALEPAGRLHDEIEFARAAEVAAGNARADRLAKLRLGMNAIALGFVLVVMFYFGRTASEERAPSIVAATVPVAKARAAPEPAPVRIAPPAAPSISPPLPKAEPAVSLSGAADLCVDLGRLMDERDLPNLLERAARVLYAKGLVVWTVDADGARLRPLLAHGYSDRVLARLGTLQVDADNVTSLAFRTLQPQKMVSPEKGGAGAVAVPLINATGGVGVLAAEIRSATPDEQMMAVARILAAQLSSLLAPAEAGARVAEL